MDGALYDHPDVYDALYASKDYAGEVEFVIEQFDVRGNGGDRALVIGCGTGRHAAHLIQRGFSVTGIDPNPAMLKAARTRSDATFVRGALPEIGVRGRFDLVWAPFTVLNYLPPDEFGSALHSMANVLAPGGLIVFDLGDFPSMTAPALQLADGDEPVARIFWYRRPDNTTVRMDALVFVEDTWFADRHTLTDYPAGVAAAMVRDRGFSVEVNDWYGTRTSMPDPAVVIASDGERG